MELSIIILTLCLFATSQRGNAHSSYSLCSQVFQMHEYCTHQESKQQNVTFTGGRKVMEGRIGKSGPPGPSGPMGIVNYTLIEENMKKKYEAIEARIDAKLKKYETLLNKSTEKVNKIPGEQVQTTFPTDCRNASLVNAKIRQSGGGVFDVYPETRDNKYEVYCDFVADGGGWTVFQRRMDGSVDFYRGWDDYVNGFGEADKEMWLGLETIYQLTKDGNYELRVDLGAWDGTSAFAKYGTFSIGGSSDNYRINIGDYSGDAGDALSYHNGQQFTAVDRDNDPNSYLQCAHYRGGSWWFRSCANSNLNGLYKKDGVKYVLWNNFKGAESLKFTEMKFKKKG